MGSDAVEDEALDLSQQLTAAEISNLLGWELAPKQLAERLKLLRQQFGLRPAAARDFLRYYRMEDVLEAINRQQLDQTVDSDGSSIAGGAALSKSPTYAGRHKHRQRAVVPLEDESDDLADEDEDDDSDEVPGSVGMGGGA